MDEAFHTLRSLDHSIHVANVVGSTSDCVTADVAANNFAFAPRGDLRSVAQYHFWALAQILRISYHPAELHFQGMVDVGDLYNVRELGDPPVNANNPATYRRAQSTVYLSSNEAVDLCAAWAVQVVQIGDSEFDLWDALSGVETQMESNPGATQQFFTAWRSGAGRSRAERFYHALTALRQPQPQQPPPAPAAPPPFGGPEAFRLLFTSLLDASRADAIACALRRVYPNERMYNDTRSAGLGMFDNDLTVWLSEAVACGKLLREDAMAAAGDAQGALALIHRIAGATVPSQPLPQAPFAGGAPLGAADYNRQRRVYVNTATDDDGQDYATTTTYGMLDAQGCERLVRERGDLDAAYHAVCTPELRAQLCANPGAVTLDANGSVVRHVTNGYLVWAGAKQIPKGVFENGGPAADAATMLIKTREVVEHEVQRRAVLATGGSGINSRGRMLPPSVLSALRQGKFLGPEQKYSARSQKYSVTRFDNGPYLFVPTSVTTPPNSTVEFITYAMGRGRFSANADVVVAAQALSAYTAAVDTAAGKVGLSGFTRLNDAFYRQQRASAPLGAWDPEQKWDLWLCGMVLLSAALQQWTLSDICSKKSSLESVYEESANPLTGRQSVELNPAGEFFQQFTAIIKSAVDLHKDSALRATSLLADYAPLPAADASAVALQDASAAVSFGGGAFVARPPTPAADVEKCTLLSEAQRVTSADARDRRLMSVFRLEPDLNGLCFNAVMVCGGCTSTACDYCARASKNLFARDKARCVAAALRVASATKADGDSNDRDRSRSRERDGGRSSSRDRDGSGRGRSPGRGQ